MAFIVRKSKIPLSVRRFIHNLGIELMSEQNYYYVRSLFIRFYRNFSIENVVVCILVGAVAFLAVRILGQKWQHNKKKSFAAAGLSVYGYLLYLYTIAFRPTYSVPQYELKFLWSYGRAVNGSAYLWIEIILNYILFLPVGVLIPILVGCGKRKDKKIFIITILTGLLISFTIELLQLILCRGLFEWDDILGNVIGTAIGYGIYKIISGLWVQNNINFCR